MMSDVCSFRKRLLKKEVSSTSVISAPTGMVNGVSNHFIGYQCLPFIYLEAGEYFTARFH